MESDFQNKPMSYALDASYLGLHAPTAVKHIIILSWTLLITAMLTAFLERAYSFKKSILVFGGLLFLMWSMTSNTLTVYAPYLEVR